MSTILCPVCETENAATNTHCEVCGERLTPPAEGEVLSPEESVAATIAAEPTQESTPSAGFSYDEEDSFHTDPNAAPGESMGHGAVGEPVVFEQDPAPAPTGDKPPVLYSSLSGEPFVKGSPEYEEGFGPMGEPLVETPPAAEAQPEPTPEPAPEPAAPVESDEDVMARLEALEEEVAQEAPPEPAAPAAPAPTLPQPGTFAEPATLTLYVNRQPVHTHNINTDETLIGRKDIRSDVYPDIDLTEHDPEVFVSRKHAYIYRQNKNYTLYAISNGGVQLNSDLLQLGDRKALKDGDVIVIAGFLAFKFKLPEQ